MLLLKLARDTALSLWLAGPPALLAGWLQVGRAVCWPGRLWLGLGGGACPHPQLGGCDGLWGSPVPL